MRQFLFHNIISGALKIKNKGKHITQIVKRTIFRKNTIIIIIITINTEMFGKAITLMFSYN